MGNNKKLSRIGIIIQSLTSDWRQCCTLSSNIQMSPWRELSSINNFAFHGIRCLGLNQEGHHTTYIIHQESEIHIRWPTIKDLVLTFPEINRKLTLFSDNKNVKALTMQSTIRPLSHTALESMLSNSCYSGAIA